MIRSSLFLAAALVFTVAVIPEKVVAAPSHVGSISKTADNFVPAEASTCLLPFGYSAVRLRQTGC